MAMAARTGMTTATGMTRGTITGTATTKAMPRQRCASIPMAADPALTLARWVSPGFPVGSFAYSHGLEWAIEAGDLASAAELQTWLEALLHHGTGRNDAIFIVSAYAAQEPVQLEALDALCLAFCAAQGRVTETREQGAAFARTLRAMGLEALAEHTYPVAVGRAAALKQLPLDLTLRFYLQAFAANLVSAAVRRVPLGQTDGQRVLAALQPGIEDLARESLTLGPDDLHASTFMADIAAMQHETLHSKVFRT